MTIYQPLHLSMSLAYITGFDHHLGSYMIYNLAVIFALSYLGTYEHVDYPFLYSCEYI
jgi:hypothetical protein